MFRHTNDMLLQTNTHFTAVKIEKQNFFLKMEIMQQQDANKNPIKNPITIKNDKKINIAKITRIHGPS